MFAFAGVYQWTLVPLFAGVAWLAASVRPRVAHEPFAAIDIALLVCVAVVAMQLVPLPDAARQAISPASFEFDRAIRVEASVDSLTHPRPLSLDPQSTAWALATLGAFVVLFWCGRACIARGGLRIVARTVAATGLTASTFALAQHATAPLLLYWRLRPESTSARPYTPFVNRNDLACWLVMAIPLTTGYLLTRIRARLSRQAGAPDFESAFDATTMWLATSACVMLGTLFATESRSGLTAAAASLLALIAMSRGRADRRSRGWIFVAIAGVLAVAAAYGNFGALANRVGDAMTDNVGGRRAIWRETWTMMRDFWAAGVGAGAYERGMLVYQTSPRTHFYFNHAHNGYLQILSEGGLMLAVPAAVALMSGIREVVRRLRDDRSAAYWIRAGATSGMIAAAVQSVWETGLQRPANAVLFAVLAGVALYDSSRRRSSAPSGPTTIREPDSVQA